jgi:hypothetical protein
MSDLLKKYWVTISVVVLLGGVFVAFMGNNSLHFPAFEHRDSTEGLIPMEPFEEIAENTSRFLWESRALDLTMQAFVITTAVICCLALIKPEEVEV